jgi:hypothetical protein
LGLKLTRWVGSNPYYGDDGTTHIHREPPKPLNTTGVSHWNKDLVSTSDTKYEAVEDADGRRSWVVAGVKGQAQGLKGDQKYNSSKNRFRL